jgi:hypothetical protein
VFPSELAVAKRRTPFLSVGVSGWLDGVSNIRFNMGNCQQLTTIYHGLGVESANSKPRKRQKGAKRPPPSSTLEKGLPRAFLAKDQVRGWVPSWSWKES